MLGDKIYGKMVMELDGSYKNKISMTPSDSKVISHFCYNGYASLGLRKHNIITIIYM